MPTPARRGCLALASRCCWLGRSIVASGTMGVLGLLASACDHNETKSDGSQVCRYFGQPQRRVSSGPRPQHAPTSYRDSNVRFRQHRASRCQALPPRPPSKAQQQIALQPKQASNLVGHWVSSQLLFRHPGVLGGASPARICNCNPVCLSNTLQSNKNVQTPASPSDTAAWLDLVQFEICLKPISSKAVQPQPRRLNVTAVVCAAAQTSGRLGNEMQTRFLQPTCSDGGPGPACMDLLDLARGASAESMQPAHLLKGVVFSQQGQGRLPLAPPALF